MGTVAFTEVKQLGPWDTNAGQLAVYAKVTFSASYATGGDTLPMTTLGLKAVKGMLLVASAYSGEPFTPSALFAVPGRASRITLVGTTAVPLVKVEDGGAAPAEVANATNLSAVSFYAIFFGTTT